jgi:dipeptidase E
MQPHLFAIGGGRLRGPVSGITTTRIDRAIVKASGREAPRLLFLPTASGDDEDYCAAIERQFGQRLGCSVEHLLLLRERPTSDAALARRFARADIIYVGGGNTLRMMKLWRRLGVDTLLERAAARGTVCAGLSAGAICWFRHGNSDSRKFSKPGDRSLIRVRGLGWVDALLCPHYDSERHRQAALRSQMKVTPGVALALEDNTAIEIRGAHYRIHASQPQQQAWRVRRAATRIVREPLLPSRRWGTLEELIDPAALLAR